MEFKNLADWNPWWSEGAIPQALKGIRRDASITLDSLMEQREIIVLSGVRRSGKTTLMYQAVDRLISKGVTPENILFLNLEDPALMREGLDNIFSTYRQHLLPEGRAYIFLDEIQAVSGWEGWLKRQYDLNRPLKFIVSGSNSSLLSGEYSTYLTGRNINVPVFPLSFREFLRFSKKECDPEKILLIGGEAVDSVLHSLRSYLENGGFPEPFFRNRAYRILLLQQYFNDILYRDIVFRYRVDPHKLSELALFLITNSGNPMTMRRLRGASGLSLDTIRSFLSYLEDAFLLRRVNAFSFSYRASLNEKLPKKYYCVDTGLRNAIAHRFSEDAGRMAENAVAVELQRRGINFHYWHERNAEVDFVYLTGEGRVNAINVCYSDKIPEREVRGLEQLTEAVKGRVEELLILSMDTTKTVETGEGHTIRVYPLWRWLLEG